MKTTKKFWSMVLCSCLLLSLLCIVPVGAAEQLGEELVPEAQGAFNGLTSGKPGYLGNWQIEGNGSIVPRNPEDASSEDEYLKLVSTSDIQAKATLSRTFFEGDIAPKKTYLFSLAYYSETANQAYIQMYEYAGSSSTGGSHKIDLPSTGGAWKETAFLFTTDASSAGTVNSISVSLNCHKFYVETTGTDTVLFDNISIREVNTAEYDVVSRVIAGSETADGYKANDAEGVVLQLLPLGWTSTDKAVVTGYVKAAQGESVTVSAGAAFAPDSAGKSFTGTGEWIPFAFSGIAYNGNITVTAMGNVELKGITIEKDVNLLSNGSFETNDTTEWKELTSNRVADADAFDGTAYAKVDTKGKYIYYNAEAGTRYLFSVWYKTNITVSGKGAGIRVRAQNNAMAGTGKDSAFTHIPYVQLPATDVWKKVEVVFEMPAKVNGKSGTAYDVDRRYIQLGLFGGTSPTTGEYIAFDSASLVKLTDENEKLGLYTPIGTVSADSDATYGTLLGEPVATASGANMVNAVYLSASSAPATASVIIAAYQTVNGVKQLSQVEISPATVGMYPVATLDTSALAAGTEIRAFVWDGISGLRPLEKAVATTK